MAARAKRVSHRFDARIERQERFHCIKTNLIVV